jgi:G3E family GTPase
METIPIWLVVGFLGSGKTTVLRRLVHHAHGRELLFIVNEFSAVDVDAGLVEREGGTAIAVAGGSIFCRCLITEFISTL